VCTLKTDTLRFRPRLSFSIPNCTPLAIGPFLLLCLPLVGALAIADDISIPGQRVIDKIVCDITPAVVAISFDEENRFDSSGFIISNDGLVLSHCHHTASLLETSRNSVLQRTLPVILSDGAEVEATLLATHRCSSGLIEYSLLKLPSDRQWPFIELSTDDCPASDSWCLHFGHPFGWRKSRQAVPRLGRIVLANAGGIATTCLVAPGDSGGPLVNLQGKVIGIATGYGGVGEDVYPTFHTNASVVRSNQLALELLSSTLETEIHTAKAPQRRVARGNLDIKAASEITVQILSGETVVALGTVVDRNGLIVTKLSELKSEVAVALPSQEIVAVQLIAKSTEHDLALLKVDASDLGRIQASAAIIERGMLVVSAIPPGEESKTGMVGDARIQEVAAGDQNAWPELERTGGLSERRSGFRMVFVHDCAIAPNECGGPLTTIDGRVLGVNIARAGRESTYAIPLSTIFDFVAHNQPAVD